MNTKKNIQKIEILPSNALIKNKKGGIPLIILGCALFGIGVLGFGAAKGFGWIGDDSGDEVPQTLTIATPTGEEKNVVINPVIKDAMSCDGVTSVKALYDDKNRYKLATDPASHVTVFEKNGGNFTKTIADDAASTTVPILSKFKGLAGNNAGTPVAGYFSEVIEFESVCSDLDGSEMQPRLSPASAPSITIVNRDGTTANSDSNHEAMDADTEYTAKMVVISPSNACSSYKYGALAIFEYDATYVSKIESSDLSTTGFDGKFLVPHETNHSGSGKDMDQFYTMKYNGILCDGDEDKIKFSVKTVNTAIGEDQANVKVHWYPLNQDLTANEYELITGVYDEDNNVISVGNTTATYYSA